MSEEQGFFNRNPGYHVLTDEILEGLAYTLARDLHVCMNNLKQTTSWDMRARLTMSLCEAAASLHGVATLLRFRYRGPEVRIGCQVRDLHEPELPAGYVLTDHACDLCKELGVLPLKEHGFRVVDIGNAMEAATLMPQLLVREIDPGHVRLPVLILDDDVLQGSAAYDYLCGAMKRGEG